MQRYLQHTGQLAAQRTAAFLSFIVMRGFCIHLVDALCPTFDAVDASPVPRLSLQHRQAPVSFKLVIAGGSTGLWSRTEFRQKEKKKKKGKKQEKNKIIIIKKRRPAHIRGCVRALCYQGCAATNTQKNLQTTCLGYIYISCRCHGKKRCRHNLSLDGVQ